MSNAKRPTLQRKTTRSSEEKRQAEADLGVSVSVDGTVYTLRMGDLTGMDARLCRREVGLSVAGVMRALQDDPDVDLVAAIVWLARRAQGEQMLSFEQVASEIGYDSEIDVVDSEPDEVVEGLDVTDPEG